MYNAVSPELLYQYGAIYKESFKNWNFKISATLVAITTKSDHENLRHDADNNRILSA